MVVLPNLLRFIRGWQRRRRARQRQQAELSARLQADSAQRLKNPQAYETRRLSGPLDD